MCWKLVTFTELLFIIPINCVLYSVLSKEVGNNSNRINPILYNMAFIVITFDLPYGSLSTGSSISARFFYKTVKIYFKEIL